MIVIKDKSGKKVRFETEINEDSAYKKTLMKEDYILFKFSVEEPVYFKKGDYCDTDFGRFEIVDFVFPKENTSTGGYDYELQLDAPYWRWKHKKLFYDRQGNKEKSWSLTRTPDAHLDILASNLKALGYKHQETYYSYSIDDSVEKSPKLVQYDNISIIDALTKIAETWECEWWITDSIIHLGRCEDNSEITFTVNREVSEMTRNDSSNTYANRIYAFGSTRNIPADYRSNSENVVIEGVVEHRLMLPSGYGFVGDANLAVEDIVEDVVVFDDVYPKRIGVVGSVVPKEYTDVIENEDGSKTNEKWNAYRFTDDGKYNEETDNIDYSDKLFFSKKYVLPGQELRITFQSGALNGLDFAVWFNPHADDEEAQPEKNSDGSWNLLAQKFEIVRNEDYGIKLPSGTMIPQSGDKYVLYGFNSKFVSDRFIPDAENTLLKKAQKYIEKTKIDPSVYTCKMNAVLCAGYEEDQYGDLVYTGHEIDLFLGNRVILANPTFFESGTRVSRIIGFEKKLDNRFECTYTIGETIQYSRIGEIEGKVETLTYKGQTYTGSGGSGGVYVIGRYDPTTPTDSNVYSAVRSRFEFINKKKQDIAEELITFLKGIILGKYIPGSSGATIDGSGNAEFLSTVIRTLLRSTKFVDGMLGEGFQLWMDEKSGLANLTLDKLTVRQVMVVLELLIERVRSIGGQFIVSAANGKIKEIVRDGDVYEITFEQDNTFVEHDLMRCATLSGVKQRSYWVEISKSDTKGITVPVSEFGEAIPEPGDECVLMGNTTNVLRQNLISIAATEDGQPRVDVLDGVKTKNFVDCLRVRLGNLDGIKDERFPLDNQPRGNGLFGDNVFLVGTFILTTGEDILTRFEIVEGKIQTAIESVRHDFISDKSYLNNPTFSSGMDSWDTENEAVFFTIGGKWLWVNDAPLTNKTDYACVKEDKGRTAVFIHNKYILQKHENFKSLPEFKELNPDGLKKSEAIYLAFFYRCASAGHLTIEFVNTDNNGFEEFDMFLYESDIEASEDYLEFNHQGAWNGTGDFKLSFTGDIYIYMLVLSTDRVNSLVYKYRTLFEQSDKLLRIAAENFDINGNPIESSQIVTKADMNLITSGLFDETGSLISGAGLITKNDAAGMFVIDENGNLKSLIGVSADGIKIKGDYITLEGLVTANDNFKILQDGSIETKNAKIYGTVYAEDGKIGGFTLDDGSLYWKGYDYFGGDSRSVRIGVPSNNNSGMIDINFNAATEGKFGIKVIGSNSGGACIYASRHSSENERSYPIMGQTYAGYFDGAVFVKGTVSSELCISDNFGAINGRNPDGSISYNQGIDYNFGTMLFRKGLLVKAG